MKPTVGSKWVAKVNHPQSAGITKGDKVEMTKMSGDIISYQSVDQGTFWVADLSVWYDNFEPYTPKDIKGPDNVNSPAHYGQGKIEAIEYIEDFLTKEEYIGYLRGNISKYLHRWRYKNGVEDLKKAQWYLNRLIQTQED